VHPRSSRLPAAAGLPALLLAIACAAAGAVPSPEPPPAASSTTLVEANAERGFHYPYLLVVPAAAEGAAARPGALLVEPNNTGRVSDDFIVHLSAARDLADKAIGGFVARELGLPLLVPVFPRPETRWELYTHQLDRDTLLVEGGMLQRLDLQLLAMIDDARARLATAGWRLPEKVLLTGFSASGSFVNRFTALHPERVQAVAAGGLNGNLILPLASLGGRELAYPLGVADVATVAGSVFDAPAWRKVPQFLYMGALDDNDAVQFDDGYTAAEKAIVDAVIGARMQPDRWQRCQQIYREAGAHVEFRTYPGVGHFTDRKVNEELRDFFRAQLAAAPVPSR
jgi:hypothetical protein